MGVVGLLWEAMPRERPSSPYFRCLFTPFIHLNKPKSATWLGFVGTHCAGHKPGRAPGLRWDRLGGKDR